jgi:hypothetical protein
MGRASHHGARRAPEPTSAAAPGSVLLHNPDVADILDEIADLLELGASRAASPGARRAR